MSIKFNANKYSQASLASDYYSDIYTNLDIHPATGDAMRLRNDSAVIQSVRNLLLTGFYERPFQPLIGSRLRESLFEDVSVITSIKIKTAIEDTLKNYEPRVQLLETIVEPAYDENGYNIRLKFSLINSIQPVEIDFFLNRVR
jgi:phage baseplate assembly protein W